MGNRFIASKYPFYDNNDGDKRRFLQINDSGYEKHFMKPYGIYSSKFSYRNRFEKKNGTRICNKNAKRMANKASRRVLKQQIFEA